MNDQLTSCKSVASFFAGRSIFVTGATGFLGKALIEKMLRSCPDLKEIFLLMRPKKEMSIDERLKKILASPLYDKLRNENPKVFEKLIPVRGDIAAEGLGLPPVERRFLIERVSIIFHIAASVRFDDHLKDAVFVNLRSTRDICILAGNMKKLVALVHVSSTYTQADKPEVEEILYPVEVDWKKTIKIAETVDDEILKAFTFKYLDAMPNTYTFTKRLAEQVISDYSKDLPCVIVRPSIVVASMLEPLEGWLDNFHGPVGLMIGGGKGILRAVYMNGSTRMDFIPVDLAAKALLLACWKRGCVTVTQDPSTFVYNCSSSMMKGVSAQELVKLGLEINSEVPLENIVWYPNVTTTNSRTIYYILVLLLHLLPALLIDGLLKLAGHKPLLVRLQRRIYISNISLSYFLSNQWKFHNKKIMNLMYEVPNDEQEAFGFTYFNYDIINYFRISLLGAKVHLLNESLDNLPKARRHYERITMIDRIFKGILMVLFIFALYHYGVFARITNFCDTIINTILYGY